MTELTPRLVRLSNSFLVEVMDYARDNSLREFDLVTLPTQNSFGLNNTYTNEGYIRQIAADWESRGFGKLNDVDLGLMRRPYFAPSPLGFAEANRLKRKWARRRFFRRFRSPNWTAIAAIISAVAAVASAIFSYLALQK